VDINDPGFWQKWAKKADIDVNPYKVRRVLLLFSIP